MSNLDGMGPEGKGPMTGRGMGPCSNCPRNNFNLRGRGRGFRSRRLAGNRFYQGENLDEKIKILEEELLAIKEEIASLKIK